MSTKEAWETDHAYYVCGVRVDVSLLDYSRDQIDCAIAALLDAIDGMTDMLDDFDDEGILIGEGESAPTAPGLFTKTDA